MLVILKITVSCKISCFDQAEILAAHLVVKMKELIDQNPTAPVDV